MNSTNERRIFEGGTAMSVNLPIGSLCTIQYKTGRYIAEFVEPSQNSPRAIVKILSVVDHPEQGDLHHPYQADVPLFHQRKAAAYLEHVLIPLGMMELYSGEPDDYQASLARAYQRQLLELADKKDDWSRKAKEQLVLLGHEYGFDCF
jgi:kinase-associated protein B